MSGTGLKWSLTSRDIVRKTLLRFAGDYCCGCMHKNFKRQQTANLNNIIKVRDVLFLMIHFWGVCGNNIHGRYDTCICRTATKWGILRFVGAALAYMRV
jgi:hypothetical protein